MADRTDEEEKEEHLAICSACGRIRVDNKHNFWLNEEDNPEAYKNIRGRYGKTRISHSYCPECLKKQKKA